MSAIGGWVGGIVGANAQQGDKTREEKARADALAAARGYNTHSAGQGGTEFDKIDPTSRDAMLRALTDYESKVNQGGLDAKARANLAAGTAGAEQASQRMAAQIQGEAARRGAAQGPAAMIAQQVASQQAGERARQTGLDSAAIAEQARDAALKGQLGAAGMVHQTDAERAQAQDAINQFNIRNAQQNIANDRARAGQEIGVLTGTADMYGGRQRNDVKDFGEIGSGVGGIADYLSGMPKMGGGGLAAGTGKISGAYDPSEGYE